MKMSGSLLRGQELRLAYEIMLSVSLVTQSVGLYLHPRFNQRGTACSLYGIPRLNRGLPSVLP